MHFTVFPISFIIYSPIPNNTPPIEDWAVKKENKMFKVSLKRISDGKVFKAVGPSFTSTLINFVDNGEIYDLEAFDAVVINEDTEVNHITAKSAFELSHNEILDTLTVTFIQGILETSEAYYVVFGEYDYEK